MILLSDKILVELQKFPEISVPAGESERMNFAEAVFLKPEMYRILNYAGFEKDSADFECRLTAFHFWGKI